MPSKMKSPLQFKRAAEAPELPSATVGFILFCLRQFRGLLLVMLLLEAGQAGGSILVPYAIKALMDALAQQPNVAELWTALEQPLLLLIGLNVGEVLFSRGSGAVLIVIGPRLRQRTSRLLYAYLQQHSMRYFGNHFAGSLAHRISETAMSVNHTVWSVLCDFWPISITFMVSVCLLLQVHTGLGGFVAGWVFMYVGISYWLATRCQPYAQNYAATRSLVNGKIVDAVTNMSNAKLFARLDYEREYLDAFLETEVQQGRRTFWYMERVRWFQFTAAALLKIGTIAYALKLWSGGEISVGDFAMSTGLALLIIGDARNLTRRFLEFFEYVGNVANGVDTIVQSH
jgi:ABC-type multidrug transport system, ATPase and permease components